VKLLEDDYVRPDFPPSLEWYDVHRGMEHAGELLATFELLQVRFLKIYMLFSILLIETLSM